MHSLNSISWIEFEKLFYPLLLADVGWWDTNTIVSRTLEKISFFLSKLVELTMQSSKIAIYFGKNQCSMALSIQMAFSFLFLEDAISNRHYPIINIQSIPSWKFCFERQLYDLPIYMSYLHFPMFENWSEECQIVTKHH